ncbi:NitT/TauT family transport system permease protein [Alkalithermobacter thermoalcaliphilus JW-YL-7 = DSM 7308]|uniref:ABC-type transporter, integral membrane subunit n=1 Tax=Alkalithermobacter thermoalcaliphilus JW-YL-7 = DSM 7308 TaxID=1121328 RepID=A0A150FTH5_CLOPD|nr:ABC-type transporter, integral membrane subunit [[Clostridium] paradoxum JW-YL-7 = DSM 7308]SHK37655.1 NitT/TauT family transport system permease protein [[Clostridium] paradoxum JW-YL-7 = DSM 7308]
MIKQDYSKEYIEYINSIKLRKIKINIYRISILIAFLVLWEVLANLKIIDQFLFSKPSAILTLMIRFFKTGEIFKHIGISFYETVMGFTLGTLGGIIIAIILWWNDLLAEILDPFLVVLNALPKTALAPIIIVWAGAGVNGIIVIAVTISIIVTILSAYNYFKTVDEEKIKMLKSFGANKYQILVKLILPSNIGNIINIIKINIGLSWVGVIVGEFLVSRYGIGYLIVYGGQVFKLDLVMMGVIILAVCALFMYQFVNIIEKKIQKY